MPFPGRIERGGAVRSPGALERERDSGVGWAETGGVCKGAKRVKWREEGRDGRKVDAVPCLAPCALAPIW